MERNYDIKTIDCTACFNWPSRSNQKNACDQLELAGQFLKGAQPSLSLDESHEIRDFPVKISLFVANSGIHLKISEHGKEESLIESEIPFMELPPELLDRYEKLHETQLKPLFARQLSFFLTNEGIRFNREKLATLGLAKIFDVWYAEEIQPRAAAERSYQLAIDPP